jgi:hypothetical protein
MVFQTIKPVVHFSPNFVLAAAFLTRYDTKSLHYDFYETK